MIRSVWVIEDVAEMREWLSLLLSSFFARLHSPPALQTFATPLEFRIGLSRESPDLIFLDEFLGVLPGEDLASLIEEIKGKNLLHRVILVTGFLKDSSELAPPGILGRLQKPNWEVERSGTRSEQRFLLELEELLTRFV